MPVRRLLLALLAIAGVLVVWTCGPESEGEVRTQDDSATGAPLERRPPFFRLDPLEVRLAPESISLEATYDTQPALAVDAAGVPWSVWVGHDYEGRDRLWSSRRVGERWTDPETVTPADGEYLRPVLARLGAGVVCLWTTTGARTGIWMASADGSGSGWSEPVRVTPEGHHLNPEIAESPDGGLWLTWQAAVPGGFDLMLAHHSGEAQASWTAPRVISDRPGAHWDPAVACAPDGSVSVVWSRFEHGDYDLWLVRLDGEELSEPRVVTDSGVYDMHPDLAVDDKGRLWLVWDRMDLDQHGSSGRLERTEDGALINIGVGSRSVAEVAVLCIDGELHLAPDMRPPGPPRTHRVENAAYPRAAIDASGAVWVVYRAWGVKLKAPHSYWWDVLAMRCTADGWSQPSVLARSDGNLEEPALVTVGDELWVAAAMEHRVTALPGNPHPEDGPRSYTFDHHWNLAPQGDNGEIYVSRLGAQASGPPELRSAPGHSKASPMADGDDWVERDAARHAIEVEGQRFELFYGDTHRHSNISRCTAGSDATVEDHHRYARDVMRLDFVVVSDHSGQTSDFNWWTLCKAAELHHVPGELVTLFGYEISNSYPTGHKNLIFPERPDVPLRLALDGVASGPAIWEKLAASNGANGVRAITIPHTPAMPAGTDWEDYDPRYERLVEIFQPRTGSSEHAGAPRLAHASVNELGFVHRALDKGHRLGFIASTDHGNGASYACVYARGSTREDIFEALHAKRCYGATGYGIVLDVRADGRPMGSEFSADGPVEIQIEARAPTALAQAVLFAGTEVAATFELSGAECSVVWTDPNPPVAGDRSYYVRLELENDELAWLSPIWVTY